MSVMNAQVAGTPPLHIVGLKNILVETLNNVRHERTGGRDPPLAHCGP